MRSNINAREFEYDACLSFAGEQRDYVGRVAEELKKRNVNVFYDAFEEAKLWGTNLHDYLADIYSKKARYCIIFASRDYAAKVWTNHERRFAQARALEGNQGYILPVRFDDTEIPGLLPTIGYIEVASKAPGDLAELFLQKLGRALPSASSTTPPDAYSKVDYLSEHVRELIAQAKGADADLYRSVGDEPSIDRIHRALVRAQELDEISEVGCRVNFFGTGRYLRFMPRVSISRSTAQADNNTNGIDITLEEANATKIRHFVWESPADAGDISLRIAEAAQSAGCYPGDSSFDAGKLFAGLSVLLSVGHAESTEGRVYPIKRIVQLCLPQWAICETGLYRIDGPFYQIAAWRLNEDWWSHMQEKIWLDPNSLDEALVTAKALSDAGRLAVQESN